MESKRVQQDPATELSITAFVGKREGGPTPQRFLEDTEPFPHGNKNRQGHGHLPNWWEEDRPPREANSPCPAGNSALRRWVSS